ncbi:hypothetical protein J6590_069434 [Homalodisca vitripennis]|nr:hypothetical protein J6590_069434 [Homalodisca vitripennis]
MKQILRCSSCAVSRRKSMSCESPCSPESDMEQLYLTAKLTEYPQLIEDLKVKNIQLQRKVTDLELRIEDNEQYMRSITLIEIQGIPESKNEDVYEVVKKRSYRCLPPSKKWNDADRPAGIIAKFVRREDKLKFLEKRRVKKNLNSHDVGYTSTTANPV